MASAGGGNFYYIEDERQIADFMTSELGEALEVVARDVHLEVRLPYGAQLEMLGRERVDRRGPEEWTVEVGDLVARQEREIVLRVNFPHGSPGEPADVTVAVRDRDAVLADGRAAARWVYADHATNDRQPRTHDVDRLVAQLVAARARMDAVAFNKAGDFRRRRAVAGVATGSAATLDGDQSSLPGRRARREAERRSRRDGAGDAEGDVQHASYQRRMRTTRKAAPRA
jgi:hypothetical protein